MTFSRRARRCRTQTLRDIGKDGKTLDNAAVCYSISSMKATDGKIKQKKKTKTRTQKVLLILLVEYICISCCGVFPENPKTIYTYSRQYRASWRQRSQRREWSRRTRSPKRDSQGHVRSL